MHNRLRIDSTGQTGYPNPMEDSFLTDQPPVYSVSDLNAYIRALLESNENLMDIWVSGEISNLSSPSSGHIYFTLKDAEASIRCVAWRENARRLRGFIRDGLAVEAHGYVSVYEQGGQYQLYVDTARPAGEGFLYQEFLRLKAELEAEGLFDEERKRPVPRFPDIIGVVTSPTGAAFQDMLNTLRSRFPLVKVVLAPTAVQGETAPSKIIEALGLLNCLVHPDVIIIGRGGGSLEDLWAFNDEGVVRAVADSEAPVISGVGHETDFTLTDFAADVRAPTPTGAAVLAAPDVVDLAAELAGWEMRLMQTAVNMITEKRSWLAEAGNRLEYLSPVWRIRQNMQRLDEIENRMRLAVRSRLRSEIARIQSMENTLLALDPAGVLKRGYALVRDESGALVSSAAQVKLGQMVEIRMKDGTLGSEVRRISLEKKGE